MNLFFIKDMYLCTKENIMHHPEIAIVDPNTLTCLGLKNILEDIIPMATIRVFHSFGELTDDTPDMYAHYFISAQIYFEHTSFFLLRKPKTIVLAGGDNQPQLSGVPKLNIYQDEGSLIKDIHQLRQYGHQARKQAADKAVEVACKLVALGIEAIWNFAPIDLHLSNNVIVENVHLTASLMQLSYKLSEKNK